MMSNHAHANDFPAPFVEKAQGDIIHYSQMNGGVFVTVRPYTGMNLGDNIDFHVRFDNTNGPGWRVPVDQPTQLTNGVMSAFDRNFLNGNTWVEISFNVGPKKSEIRKYTLAFD